MKQNLNHTEKSKRHIPLTSRVILAVLVAILIYGIIWVASQFKEPPGIGWLAILLIGMSYLTFEFVSRVQHSLSQRKTNLHESVNLILSVAGAVIGGVVVYSAFFYGFKWLDYWLNASEPPYIQHMVMAMLVGLIMSLVFALIQVGFSWRSEYFKSQVENERFKAEIAQANLSILKNQLDPHFMFNNFNTLYYLIDEDSDLARKFLKNVSTIYRYILQNNDKELIPAREEYDIARQYLAVIQQRYTELLTLEDEISPESLDQKDVPPLVLQQLIENAIKHNRIDEKSPLRLTFTTDNGFLTVANNRNPKRPEHTAKTGLNNIQKRYKYLTNREVVISKSREIFSVSVPLINAHD